MFHLTWKGMIGRRKESSLLLIVLVLSFLLSSALSIVLPSTQAGIQLQRQKTYGSWQLMLYGESDNVCDTMAQAAHARGAKAALLPTVGVTSDDEIISEIAAAHAAGQDVARLHSGDLSIWSAMGEQLRRLRALDIPYDVTPGVPSFAAAAAVLGVELTLPGVAQSVILTRTSGRASSMPEGETLENFACTGATLAIHLSVHVLSDVVARLTPSYGAACPVAVVFRASWPDQKLVRATLGTVETSIGDGERTALILVGPALGAEEFTESRLYAGDYDRRYRPVGTEPRFPE